MKEPKNGIVNHRVELFTIRRFFEKHLGFNPHETLDAVDWLLFSEQALLEVTAGKIFRDDIGLETIRSKFSYYPEDVWRYLLSVQWRRISQDEHLMPRAGDVGDDVGSAIIAMRLARDIMRLCFLMEKVYAPYPKWFGSAFKQLSCAPDVLPVLRSVERASSWKDQMIFLAKAYEKIANIHNSLAITEQIEPVARNFHDRPYLVIEGERFSDAIYETIRDKEVLALPKHIGSIDQISDSTDVLSYPMIRKWFKTLYETKT